MWNGLLYYYDFFVTKNVFPTMEVFIYMFRSDVNKNVRPQIFSMRFKLIIV